MNVQLVFVFPLLPSLELRRKEKWTTNFGIVIRMFDLKYFYLLLTIIKQEMRQLSRVREEVVAAAVAEEETITLTHQSVGLGALTRSA